MLATIFSRVPSSLLLSVAQKEEQKEYLIERIAAE
jgi:hypothetical protein